MSRLRRRRQARRHGHAAGPRSQPANCSASSGNPFRHAGAIAAGVRTIGRLSGGFIEEALRGTGAVAVYRDVADLLDRYEGSPLAREKAEAVKGQG
jgi:hypothetical protein